MSFRNNHPAFAVEGNLEIRITGESGILIKRTYRNYFVELTADLKNYQFEISCS